MKKQQAIPATFMRGGTSKGVFFNAQVLPASDVERDALFLRVLGSPDPYGKQIDGMGGATSSTSKVVIVGPSAHDDCDVDYRFGAVAIDRATIDYSGNCGNLTAAVGPFAIREGLVAAPESGIAEVRIWQSNVNKCIIAKVPMIDGEPQECGDFILDGVAFPAAEITLDFLDPADPTGLFPTGNRRDVIEIPGLGHIEATLINAGNPHIMIDASALGLRGDEMPQSLNQDKNFLERCELIRSHGAVAMGLGKTPEAVTQHRPHTPKLVWISDPCAYTASSGRAIPADAMQLTARILSMGLVHHAMTGTGGVALAAASAVDGTLVYDQLVNTGFSGQPLTLAHPSGLMAVGATAQQHDNHWHIEKVTLSRSARRLMQGMVFVP